MKEVLMRKDPSPTAKRGIFLAGSVILFCIQIDFFSLNMAVPGIADEFGVTVSAAQWALSAYMLAVACWFIIGGRLGDIFGRRRILFAGISLFTAGSVGCALAPGLGLLIAARIVQGGGAGIVFPVCVAVISNAYADETRARALGAVFGLANIGTALGPFVGGGLTGGPGWRWIFWLVASLSALALIVTVMYVPDSRDTSVPRQLDMIGCITVICSLAAFTVAVERGSVWGWDKTRTLTLLVVAVVTAGLFIWRERLAPHPLIDLRLFRNTPYLLVTSMGSVTNLGFAITFFLAALYLQGVQRLSPMMAGVVFLAPSLLVALSGPLGARLGRRLQPMRVMALAAWGAGTGMIALSYVTAWWLYVPAFAWCGLGCGLNWTYSNVATQQVVQPARAGEASGVLLTFLVTVGAISLAGTAAVITAMAPHRAPQDVYETILRFGGAAILAASVVIMAIHNRPVIYRKVPVAPTAGETHNAKR
ncbi:MFS transporter [Streptomyces sp. 1222.5]|uniref:MFS transporter n=1 Tax=Streptomyces sp. 1222.5 TaxID=1881026 RepID=UPI003EBD55C3